MNTVSLPLASASRRLLSLVALLPLASVVHGADITWSGATSNDWFVGSNWSSNATPVQGFGTAGDGLNINSGSTVFNTSSPSAGTPFNGGTYYYKTISIGQTSGQSGSATFSGGNVTFDNNANSFIGRSGGTGSLTVSAGNIRLGGARINIGVDSGSVGSVFVNGGTLTFNRENLGITAVVGSNIGSGSITVSGGTFTTRAALQLDAGGTFTVNGSGATTIGIGSESTVDGGWIQNSGGTLRGLVDTGGVTKILVDDIAASTGGNNKNGDVTFAAGSLLDVGFVGTGVAGTWVLMQWEGSLTNNGLAFAPGVNTSIWSFNIDQTAKTLSITSAIPEPSAFAALAGLGALGFASQRRRRRG